MDLVHERLLYILLIVFLLAQIDPVHLKCDEIRVRRNFVSLSKSDWEELVQVFNEMYEKGDFERLADIHSANFRTIHDYPQFLIWHRYFVFDFENRMRTYNPELTLPYWDAAADFDAPHRASVFSSQAFGGNGDPRVGFCVRNGFQADITIKYPTPHCLRRHFQGPGHNSIHPWHSPAFITSLIQTPSSFDEFRQSLEHSLHNSIHFGIGGIYGDFSKHYSPVDALFFLHHANIDRIYSKWQLSHPHHLDAIDGHQITKHGFMSTMTPEYSLDHYNVRVGDILRTLEEPLCYTYDDIIDSKYDLTHNVENRIRKLPRRLLKKYFPKIFNGEESDFDHDFSNLRSLSRTLNRPLPPPLTLTREWFEKMKFNVTRGLEIQQKVQKFVQDMNRDRFHETSDQL